MRHSPARPILSAERVLNYRRAPHLCFTWAEHGLVCLSGTTGREVAVSPEAIRVLDIAGSACPGDELARRASVPSAFVRRLIDAGLLLPADELPRGAGVLWGTYELAVQRRAGGGRARSERMPTMPQQRKRYNGTQVYLPNAAKPEGVDAPFWEVLARRRSSRLFANSLLPSGKLVALLTGAATVTCFDRDLGVSKRPYPSGGGRHPIELYVLPFRVEGLDSVAHHFDPFDHSLTQIAGTERFINRMMRNWQCDDPIGGSGLPAAAILLTACFERTMWKYEGLGLVLVYKDAGALLQTLHLQATALNLAGHAVGGGPELAIATGLGLDPVEESYVGAFLVGQADPGRRSTGN